MDPIFKQFILTEDSNGLTDYLDNTPIESELLNMWFRQAARFPGNWNEDHDRNAWLQGFYEKYVPDECRQYELTNRRRFQHVPLEAQPEVVVQRPNQCDTRVKQRGRLLRTYPRAERERIIKDFNIQPEDVNHARFVSTRTSETVIYTMCDRSQEK